MTINTMYQRGRNDRRDGKDKKANPYTGGTIENRSWKVGWDEQDALIRNKDRQHAYKLGRKDATDSNSMCPYPVGTTANLEWQRGHDEVMEAKAKAAAEKAAKAAAEKVAA